MTELAAMKRSDRKIICCRLCGAEFRTPYSAKFCPKCRKKAYHNTYQPPGKVRK